LREPFTRFPGNAAIGEEQEPLEKAREFARITAHEMKLVGLNMDLAPVLDVGGPNVDKHLVGRTFGKDPGQVAILGEAVITGLQTKGVISVAKHFPGLGPATLDPHEDLPTIGVDAREMEEIHLVPFKAAIDKGVSAIMTSHALYPALDPDFPATLSHTICTGLLREKLGFQGLVITDDLEMGAIRDHWGVPEAALASVEAGADILLICQDQYLVLESILKLRERVIRGEIPFGRIFQSVDRIQKIKKKFLKGQQRISLQRVRSQFGA
jgi:beta-N-acetylhexosaminidase